MNNRQKHEANEKRRLFLMKNPICNVCNTRPSTEIHHLLSKSYETYYPDFIHHEDNLIAICGICHLNKSIPRLSEIDFCLLMGIEPRTKSGKTKWGRM